MPGSAQANQRHGSWGSVSFVVDAGPGVRGFVVNAEIEAPGSVLLLQRQQALEVPVDLSLERRDQLGRSLGQFRVFVQLG